jgi:hypothetical protein
MNRILPAILLSPLLAAPGPALAAQDPPAGSQPAPMPGSYQPAAVDSPGVLAARDAIQKQFAVLQIQTVKEAYVQVVAGLNFKLVCLVAEDASDPSTWEFVIWQRLDGLWQLQTARRL